jgi:5-methylcytosine-specific restriction protein A
VLPEVGSVKAKGLTQKVRDAVEGRSARPTGAGLCEKCGGGQPAHIHHRTGRQMGGSRPEWVNLPGNLLRLCIDCHDEVTNTNGNRAYVETCGWLVRRGVLLPAEIPVVLWHGLVLLDDEGSYTPALEFGGVP